MKSVLDLDTPKMDARTVTRLFSNVEHDGRTFSHQPGSVVGSTSLIAGTTIGAGILALPAFTLPSGVLPSSILLLGVWLYTLIAGLLIAEANLTLMRRLGCSGSGFLAMIEQTLGKSGSRIASGVYLFMHYALLVAYMAQGGDLLVSAINHLLGESISFPAWVGTTTFTALFGGILYLGHRRLVESLNSAFVAIVLISFVGLLVLGMTQVNPAQMLSQDWQALSPAISVMFVALFYHNVIPVVTTQLEGDVTKIRRSIVIGSAIPLVMFLAWNAVILGSVHPDLMPSDNSSVFDPLQVLRTGTAGDWLGVLVSVFSEFAIVTSFIGFVYGLIDFFKDLFNATPEDPAHRLPLYSLVLLPSMSLSALNPGIFFTALDYVGTFGISVLGGIIPAVMTWKQRYQQSHHHDDRSPVVKPLVPGGRLTLIVMIGVAVSLILRQLVGLFTLQISAL